MLAKALLWKIGTDQTSHTSYIFGTIHLQSPGSERFLKNLEVIMPKIRTVFTETGLDQSVDPKHFRLPESRSLEDYIGPKKYVKLEKILRKSFGFELEQFKSILPLIVAQNIALLSQGLHLQPSLDSSIHRLAMRLEKEYKGLESMEEQLQILSRIPIDYQIKMLLKIGRNIRTFKKSFQNLIDIYDSQDIQKMYKSSKKQLGITRSILLYERNRIMTERILEEHSIEPSLFTFGAGHLAGNNGVLPLLKRGGARLTPVHLSSMVPD